MMAGDVEAMEARPEIIVFRNARGGARGFSLIELLAVVAVIGVLSSMLLPAVAGARAKSAQAFCLNNARQLAVGWTLYAHDNSDRLAYNLGATEIARMLAQGKNFNWASSVLNWELDAGNTNGSLNTEAALGAHVARNARVFRCPADRALSGVQKEAGWTERSRSISMNAMMGDAGEFTAAGGNVNNPGYQQFMKLGEIPSPEKLFAFIEEHPDSINDGYFVNRAYSWEWMDLPASHHNGGASLAFADGHQEAKRWERHSTIKPARPDTAALPFAVEREDRADFNWVIQRMSVH